MSDCVSRREALKALVTAAGALVAIPAVEAAAEKPHLKMNDPVAVALAYYEDAKKVDALKHANYKPGQLCSNCLQISGKVTDGWVACNLFAGKVVAANGWCKVYIKKP